MQDDLVSAKLPTLRTFADIGEASHVKARAVALTNSSTEARDAASLACAESTSMKRFPNPCRTAKPIQLSMSVGWEV